MTDYDKICRNIRIAMEKQEPTGAIYDTILMNRNTFNFLKTMSLYDPISEPGKYTICGLKIRLSNAFLNERFAICDSHLVPKEFLGEEP